MVRKFHEHINRSLIKTISYRLLIIISNSLIIYAVTRRSDYTAGFIIVSNIVSTLVYFFHERFWNTVHWGKSHHAK